MLFTNLFYHRDRGATGAGSFFGKGTGSMKNITVKEAYDRIYREAGFIPTSNMSNDPNSKTSIEQESRRRALSALDLQDRQNVNSCVTRMKECCRGVYLGDSAALQILEHIGVFLAEVERAS